jgi:hypothetical protein
VDSRISRDSFTSANPPDFVLRQTAIGTTMRNPDGESSNTA